jgi:methyl-accepting chemotaxis protein
MTSPASSNGREIDVGERQIIVSRSDPRGLIVAVNDCFIALSGYTEAELLGQPDDIVRHPDMPPAVLADIAATLRAGRPWCGLTKNRSRSGDHYWTEASSTPIYEDGRVVGFLTVRRQAPRAAIAEAERLYAQLRAGSVRHVVLRNGRAVQPGLLDRLQQFNPLWKLPLSPRLMLFGAFGIGLAGLLMELALGGADRQLLWLLLGLGFGFVAYSAHWLSRDVVGRLEDATRAFAQIAEQRFDQPIDISRADEVGSVLLGLKSMQIRLGFAVEEARRQADAMARVQSGLDVAGTSLLVADPELRIIYLNRSLRELLAGAGETLAAALPGFRADALLGSGLEQFFPQPTAQRARLRALRGPQKEALVIDALTFDLSITPVLSEDRRALGYVVEWKDRTLELRTEEEVASVIRAAAAGDFSQRIDLTGKEGFLRTLALGIDELLGGTARSLAELQQVLAALAEGDLTRRVERDYAGQLAEMKRDTNLSIEQLSTIIAQIQHAAATIDRATAEIASGNADLSLRSEQQAASLEETASSMEELTSTVRNNAENARRARVLARQATEVATHGGDVVGQVVSTMDAIAAASRRIEDIIGVIDGIAFQTNILALNAAVEAARAGDQGRGFAVVAAEVRSLASRSADAAKEIKSLIGHSVQTVESGVTLVREAGSTMRQVVGSVEQVNGLMGDIAAASDEQAAGVDLVSQTIMQLDQATQQNAALVEEASAAATALEQQAGELSASVARFRIEKRSRPRRPLAGSAEPA